MKLEAVNALDRAGFVDAFGDIAEKVLGRGERCGSGAFCQAAALIEAGAALESAEDEDRLAVVSRAPIRPGSWLQPGS